MNRLRIGYFADGPWAHEAINQILADETLKIMFICARYKNPDIVLKSIAIKKSIKFITHANINSSEFLQEISKYKCDIFVSMSFNQIFAREIIEMPRLKIINCHAGKLPFYRGRNILNWVLINDEKEFGITVHYVDEGIDTGDIILQRCFQINDNDNYDSLLKKSYNECAKILYDSLKIIQNGSVKQIAQKTIHSVGTYFPRRRPGDEKIQWDHSSREIFNFVRAISAPGPQAVSYLEGDFQVKINHAELIDYAPTYKAIAGVVLQGDQQSLVVKTGDSTILVREWSCIKRIQIGDRLK